MSHPHDEFDQLLDEALASYSQAEPRLGFEQRVLHHARSASSPRRRWLPWALAVPVLATLWLLSVTRQVPTPPSIPMAPPPPVIARVAPPVAVPARVPARRPRQQVFPRDLPLSPEERALVTLTVRYPEQARQLATPVESGAIVPIEIPKIQITPLIGDIEQ